MIIMSSDVFKWIVLNLWLLIAWTSAFTVLFREPYHTNSDSGCFDYDTEFAQWPLTLSHLLEVVPDSL